MNAHTPLHDDTPADPGAWARSVTVRQVERLDQLAEAGLRLALTIEGEAAQAAAAGQPVRDDAAMAFSRVARAVRMTGLLQAKLIRDMDKALARAAAAKSPEELIDEASEEAMRLDPEGHMRKFRVERIFERVAKAECGKDEDRIDRLCIEAGERLDDEDLYGDLLERPVGELVALLCRDLGLDPDWSRLAEEAWAREEITSGTWPPSPSRGSLRSYTNVEDGRVGVNTPGLQDKELEAVDLEREPSRLQRPPFDDSEHTPIPAFPPRGGRSGAHPP